MFNRIEVPQMLYFLLNNGLILVFSVKEIELPYIINGENPI